MNKQSTAITNIEKQSGGLNIDDDAEVNNHDNTIQTDKHRMIVVSSLGKIHCLFGVFINDDDLVFQVCILLFY